MRPVDHVHFDTIDSTNREALRRWTSGAVGGPLVLTADTQSAGLGRCDRVWHSPPGGVWMTVLWPYHRPAEHYSALPLAVGAAVAEAIERAYGLVCRIKWPNDVLIHDRKLAGILCQAALEPPPGAVAVGVGVNAAFPAAELGAGLRCPPTSLFDELGVAVEPADLGGRLADRLAETLRGYDADGLSAQLGEVRRRLAWTGRTVRAVLPGPDADLVGRLIGIDEAGHLLLEVAGQRRTVAAGELLHLQR